MRRISFDAERERILKRIERFHRIKTIVSVVISGIAGMLIGQALIRYLKGF